MSEKKKYGRICMDGVSGYCVPFKMIGQTIQDELDASDDMEIPGNMSVEIVMLSDEDYDSAPEFEGW